MRSSERKRKWLGLLLAGILGVSGSVDIWANDNLEIAEEEIEVSDVAELSQNEMVPSDDIASPLLENLEEFSGDTVSSQMNGEEAIASENEAHSQLSVSDNSVSLNDVHNRQFSMAASEQIIDEEELHKELFNVVLPTEIPFKMVLFGSKRLEGLIDSERFCVENKGYKDVRISFQGVCRGKNEEDYVIKDSSVEEGIVGNKKNIWIYLRWENQKGEILEQPGIVMGDVTHPGEGEIILKAPKRDTEGKIVGENSESRVYFTFKGDMTSDTGEAWSEGEIELDLNFSMRTTDQAENKGFIDNVPTADNSAISKQPEEMDENTALDEKEAVSLNKENHAEQPEDDTAYNAEFDRIDENAISNKGNDVDQLEDNTDHSGEFGRVDEGNDAEQLENDAGNSERMDENHALDNEGIVSLNED